MVAGAVKQAIRPLVRSPLFSALGRSSSPNILATYQGLVATNGRGYTQRVAVATTKQAITRSRHVATEDITALKLVYIGFAVISGVTTGAGSTTNFRSSIEYPVGTLGTPGTRTRVLWSGVDNKDVVSSGIITSDALSITIPKGAVFYVWTFADNTGSTFLCYQSGLVDTGNGEGTQKAASGLTDVTLSGTITPNDSNMWVGPLQVVGQTTRRSVVVYGDSRAAGGSGDTYSDGAGDLGEVCRSLGNMKIGYTNFGSPGGNASDFIANNAQQAHALILGNCSDVFFQYGQNDFHAGASDATMRTRLANMLGIANAATKRKHSVTISPDTTGAWTLADGTDQTTDASFAAREAHNTWRRSGAAGCIIHDVAASMEMAGLGKWKADGTPQKYTVDGIHASQFGLLQVVADKRINPAYFVP